MGKKWKMAGKFRGSKCPKGKWASKKRSAPILSSFCGIPVGLKFESFFDSRTIW